MKQEQPNTTPSHGNVIINAIIESKALDRAIVEPNGTVFIWSANAAEQIEAALLSAGYKLEEIREPIRLKDKFFEWLARLFEDDWDKMNRERQEAGKAPFVYW